MGSSCCKGDTIQSTELESPTFQVEFFTRYPNIAQQYKALLDQKHIPQNWSISRTLFTPINGQGVFLGKRNVKTRNGYGIMLYELDQFPNQALYYIGYWHSNCKHGMGIMIDNFGSYYRGQWYNDEPNGYGEYYDTKNNRQYKGKWKNGKKEGQGEQAFPDGTKYVGNFKEDKKHGTGKFIFKEANATCFFQGKFADDRITGMGRQRGIDYQYHGPWKDGQMHGAGRSTYFNGSTDGANGKNDEFVGQFQNGLKHGYGEYRWYKGPIYKGAWVNGQIVNRGVFIQRD